MIYTTIMKSEAKISKILLLSLFVLATSYEAPVKGSEEDYDDESYEPNSTSSDDGNYNPYRSKKKKHSKTSIVQKNPNALSKIEIEKNHTSSRDTTSLNFPIVTSNDFSFFYEYNSVSSNTVFDGNSEQISSFEVPPFRPLNPGTKNNVSHNKQYPPLLDNFDFDSNVLNAFKITPAQPHFADSQVKENLKKRSIHFDDTQVKEHLKKRSIQHQIIISHIKQITPEIPEDKQTKKAIIENNPHIKRKNLQKLFMVLKEANPSISLKQAIEESHKKYEELKKQN